MFKSEKLQSENHDLWNYKSKDSFFCYATHLIYVQRAFWAQLVETVEVPFKLLGDLVQEGVQYLRGIFLLIKQN